MSKIPITLFFLLAGTIYCQACKCNDPGTIQEAYQATPIILQGKVLTKEFVSVESTLKKEEADRLKAALKAKNDESRLSMLTGSLLTKVTLEVTKAYKGEIGRDTVIIYTPKAGSACGFTLFEVGKEFLIYAYLPSVLPFSVFLGPELRETPWKPENAFWTNACTRTTEYNEAEAKELAMLSKKR